MIMVTGLAETQQVLMSSLRSSVSPIKETQPYSSSQVLAIRSKVAGRMHGVERNPSLRGGSWGISAPTFKTIS